MNYLIFEIWESPSVMIKDLIKIVKPNEDGTKKRIGFLTEDKFIDGDLSDEEIKKQLGKQNHKHLMNMCVDESAILDFVNKIKK